MIYNNTTIGIIIFSTKKVMLFLRHHLKSFLLSFLLFFTEIILAQNSLPIEYIYDAAGNRTIRQVVTIRSSSDSTVKQAKKGTTDYNETNTPYFTAHVQSLLLHVYPNPTRGLVVCEVQDIPDNTDYTMRLLDSRGRRLIEQSGQGSRIEIDLSGKPSGFYILELTIGEEHSSMKIIKQ